MNERIQLMATRDQLADWKREARMRGESLSRFIRRAAQRFSARLKKRRAEKEVAK